MCAVIEKEIGGEVKTHRLIRADTIADIEQCREASIAKAKQMIDQMGERLF
ncbi:MAG: HlyU family transcriptional regulator [Planktotalea sp.]|uniref:HlyU family transcriptional regulator n=1 Tax=Planktotalea sp. TaxID=2029877 RepID=UPI0002D7D87D|nr:HlyU family transcriptional regulator [Planktotalea sp.]